MQLRVIRLVVATFGTRLIEWSETAYAETSVAIKPYGAPFYESRSNATSMLVEASRVVEHLPVDGNVLRVPEVIRRDLETAIESHTDIIAVLNRCTRSLGSPMPYFAIEPLDDPATTWLHGKRLHVSTTGIPVRMWHRFDPTSSLLHLHDRLDGVTLVAESLGHTHATGQLHELIRLFERAFALPAGRVCRNELPVFLTANEQGYTSSEVEHWLYLRDTTSHADTRPTFALQADTRPVVNRAEQAAYDVLFNKATWRDSSLDRRNVFKPFSGSSDNKGGIFLTQGEPAKFEFPGIDGFHAYPLNVNARITNIPRYWLTETIADQMPFSPSRSSTDV